MYSSADYQRHAAADVSGRRPQAARRLQRIPPTLRERLQAAARRRFRCSTSGVRAHRSPRRSWIADAAKHASRPKFRPTLTLVYLPHLDYNLQRFGPAIAGGAGGRAPGRRDLRRPDRVLRGARRRRRSCCPSTASATSRAGPHQPRAARARLLAVRDELGRELLDAGASAGVRRRRPSDRARLRQRSGADRRDQCANCRAHRRRRAGARRSAASASAASTTRAPASWSRSPSPTPGSPITTGSTTRGRPTSRAPWTSIASPATTRSSCSSIPRSGCRR